MPAKKKAKKKVMKAVKSKPAKKTVRRAPRKVASKRASNPIAKRPIRRVAGPARRDRISIVLKNLFLFGILFILSIAILWVSGNALISQLFYILAILTGFVAVAFLIILLIFFFKHSIINSSNNLFFHVSMLFSLLRRFQIT